MSRITTAAIHPFNCITKSSRFSLNYNMFIGLRERTYLKSHPYEIEKVNINMIRVKELPNLTVIIVYHSQVATTASVQACCNLELYLCQNFRMLSGKFLTPNELWNSKTILHCFKNLFSKKIFKNLKFQ